MDKGRPMTHPKPDIELLDTLQIIDDFALVKKISKEFAAQVLILNELRCIHYHLDVME